jgi:hypothetical protein
MSTTLLIVIIIIAVIVIAAIGALIYRHARARQSERLQERFGPEYDRSLERAEDRNAAESELREREKRHSELELQPLDEGQQVKFEKRWSDVQREFVDSPSRAVHNADLLIIDVMMARGYPKEEFEQRADHLSVKYPELTQQYREARRISQANEQGTASTEDLRQAVTSYRSLVRSLLHSDNRPPEGRTGQETKETQR